MMFVCALLLLTACKIPPKDGVTPEEPDGGGETENGDFIFSKKSELYIIADDFSSESGSISNIISTIDKNKDPSFISKFAGKDSEQHEHEIVFGDSDRDISRSAVMRLNRIEKNLDTDVRYLIYSDGRSIAVVYDKDSERIAVETAIKELLSIVDTEKLTLSAGVVCSDIIDPIQYYAAMDAEYEKELWEALAAKVGGGEIGAGLTDAMKQLYSLYTSDMVTWIANLYEPSICVCNGLYGETECSGENPVCGTSGFYYSNSARDNIGYLPDVESTYHALTLLNSTGITRNYDYSWIKLLDDEMLDGILGFIRAIQREDGYFVHPQWTSPGVSRISRDLSWSTAMLNLMKKAPYYDTPNGIKGIGAPKSVSSLTEKLGVSKASACSAVILTSDQGYLSHLENLDTFKSYLIALDVKNDSYSAGNTLTSQAGQIKERDRQLGLSGEGSLYQAMIDHLNECQNPENGTWYFKTPDDPSYDLYYAVNGLMKVTGVYGDVYPIQYVDEAIDTAISAITFDKEITAAVNIYNPWFALTNIFVNLEGCGGDAGIEKIEETRLRLYESAPLTLIASRDKIAGFKKPDGSFSYHPDHSSETSQGCAAALPNSYEGDLNGNVLSSSGLLNYIYEALGLVDYQVPLFGESERFIFMNELRGLSHMNKPIVAIETEPEDFEGFDVGEVPPNSGLFASKVNNASSSIAVSARADGLGNSLRIDSKSASTGDYVHVKNTSKNQSATVLVFEGEFKLDYSSSDYPVQIFMGESYMFTFRIVNETVHIVESSSANGAKSVERDLGAEIAVGDWFGVRVEYYPSDHDGVRIKFYLDENVYDDNDDSLIAVTDNYYDRNGKKLESAKGTPSRVFGETNIYILSDAVVQMEMDNVRSYVGVDKYMPSDDESLHYNIDATAEERVYGFEDGKIPAELTVTGSGISVSTGADKHLSVSSVTTGTSLQLPVNNVSAAGDCVSLSFDLTVSGAGIGDTVMTVIEREESGRVVGYSLVARSDNEGAYLNFADYNGKLLSDIPNIRIPAGKNTAVRIDHYSDYRTSIFYINNEFIATSTTLFEDGNRHSIDRVRFDFAAGLSYKLQIDDLKFERIAKNYIDEVKPEIGSIKNDFEGSNEGIIFGANCEVVDMGGTKAAKLDSTRGIAELAIPVNHRSKVASAAFAELQLNYRNAGTNGVAHTVTLTDGNGGMIFGVVLAVKGTNIELYEILASGEPRVLLASFAKTSSVTVGFEVFINEKCAYIYLNGRCIALTECFPDMANLSNEAMQLNILSGTAASVLCVDNITAESLYLTFEKKTPEPALVGEKDLGTLVDFEKSNNANLPERYYCNFFDGTVTQNVKTVLNEVTGKYSNAVVFTTNKNNNDSAGIQLLDSEEPLDASCVTFETDFRMDIKGGSDAYKFWFFLSKDTYAATDRAYQVIFIVRDGKLCFEDRSANSGYKELKVNTDFSADEWHHMKLEYFNGTKDTARIRMTIDGEVVYVSDNYFGNTSSQSPDAVSGIRRAFFYSMGATECDLYLDNMTLYTTDETCTDSVGQK